MKHIRCCCGNTKTGNGVSRSALTGRMKIWTSPTETKDKRSTCYLWINSSKLLPCYIAVVSSALPIFYFYKCSSAGSVQTSILSPATSFSSGLKNTNTFSNDKLLFLPTLGYDRSVVGAAGVGVLYADWLQVIWGDIHSWCLDHI